tara:strand:+ start:590 stop:1516 length:927 start_codon:yes stop_codon:yes gene_type:complete
LQNKSFEITNYIGSKLGADKFNVFEYCTKEYGKDLAKRIIEKTGPVNLYHCSESEDTLTLAIEAFIKIKNKIYLDDIKNLIFVSETNVYQFPGNGFLFASKVGMNENISVYDLNAGCTGFVDALILAEKLDHNSLIVCSEAYSKNIQSFDRSVSTLFSDCSTVFFYDKKIFKVCENFSFIKKDTYDDLQKKHGKSMIMNGSKIFSFVSSLVSKKIIEFINLHKQSYDFKTLYLHQASALVLDYFKSKKELTELSIPLNLDKIGNTVSSSIPMLILDDKENINKHFSDIILCGFGVGLACSGVILKINK